MGHLCFPVEVRLAVISLPTCLVEGEEGSHGESVEEGDDPEGEEDDQSGHEDGGQTDHPVVAGKGHASEEERRMDRV